MKQNKGFTLVELLAMMIVLGIIMGVTIPNITGIVNSSKYNGIKTDATKMIDKAKLKVIKEKKIQKPQEKQCIILTLNYLDDNEDIVKGPNGRKYNPYDSFVIYTRENNEYKYYARIIEGTGDEKFAIDIESDEKINTEEVEFITETPTEIGISKTDESTVCANKVYNNTKVKNICSSVIACYNNQSAIGDYSLDLNPTEP